MALGYIACCFVLLLTERIHADEPASTDALDQLFRQLALDVMPHEYEDDDDWGKTKQFVTGLHVSRDGLKIETRRKRRPRNHGRWEKYRVRLASQDEFNVDVRDVRSAEGGKTAFTIEVVAPLEVHIRRANWRRGVQLWSISADASARVHLTLDCQASIAMDPTEIPPAVLLKPEIVAAEIQLAEFQLRRISKLGADVSDEIGDALRSYVRRRVASKGEKVANKINGRIEANQDKLRLSLAELARSPLKNLSKRPENSPANQSHSPSVNSFSNSPTP